MWAQMDSEHVPDSYMHHAYKFAKTHSSGLKQNVEDYWNRMGRPEQFDPHQAHDFFRQLMREGRADEVNAVHQRAGEKWEAIGDMVRDHARHRGLSSAEWARAAFGPALGAAGGSENARSIDNRFDKHVFDSGLDRFRT